LQSNLSELIKSKSGRRIILQLLHPNQQKYVPLHLQHMAHPPPKPASGSEILEDQVNQSIQQASLLSKQLLMRASVCIVVCSVVLHYMPYIACEHHQNMFEHCLCSSYLGSDRSRICVLQLVKAQAALLHVC